MKNIFKESFRILRRNKIVLQNFCEKIKVNQSKNVNLSKNVPEKILSYNRKLDEIVKTVTYIQENSNFFQVFLYRYFKTIEQYKQTYNTDEIGVPIFSHNSSKRYYMMNAMFLGLYIIYSYFIFTNEDIPSSIKNTAIGFSAAAVAILLLMFLYSRKHVKSFYYMKNKRIFNIETYHCFGLFNKTYTFPTKDLTKVVPLFKGNTQSRSGIFSLEFESFNKKKVFFFRPHEIQNRELYDIFIKNRMEV